VGTLMLACLVLGHVAFSFTK